MAINRDSVKPFATKEFNKNWPFCEDLAKDLFQKSLQFDSLKDFFIISYLLTLKLTVLTMKLTVGTSSIMGLFLSKKNFFIITKVITTLSILWIIYCMILLFVKPLDIM